MGDKKPDKPFWKRTPGMYADWRKLKQELVAYRILCDQDSAEYRYSTVEKLTEAFNKKRDSLLKAADFERFRRARCG